MNLTEPEHSLERKRPPYRGVRRDCAPESGVFLFLCGAASVVLAVLIVPAPLALALAAMVYYAAERDLEGMARGVIDPQGRRLTTAAQDYAILALLLAGFWFLFVGWIALTVHLR